MTVITGRVCICGEEVMKNKKSVKMRRFKV